MSIILIFLICHLPRVILNIYELIIIKQTHACEKAGYPPFAVWVLATISVSHFLLVFNSAVNMVVYCLMSARFREECELTWRCLKRKMRLKRESWRLNLTKDENNVEVNQSMNCIAADESPLGEAGKAASSGEEN